MAETTIVWRHDERRGLVRADVTAIGADVDVALGAGPAGHGVAVTQLDLPLGDPAVELAVAAARRVGFGFCGLLPEFGAGDVLRLQRLTDRDHRIDPALLASEEARMLLEVISEDLAVVGR